MKKELHQLMEEEADVACYLGEEAEQVFNYKKI